MDPNNYLKIINKTFTVVLNAIFLFLQVYIIGFYGDLDYKLISVECTLQPS